MIPLSKLIKKSERPAEYATGTDALSRAEAGRIALEEHDKKCHGGNYVGGRCKFRKLLGLPTPPPPSGANVSSSGEGEDLVTVEEAKVDIADKQSGATNHAAEYLDTVKKDKDAKKGKPVSHALSADAMKANAPAVYIGTYGHYNDGNLDGVGEASGWVDLSTFKSADDFRSWLAEQAKKDPTEDHEFMFQDFQGFPRDLYSESSVSDDVFSFIDFKRKSDLSDDAIEDITEVVDTNRLVEANEKGYIHVFNASDYGDVAQSIIEDYGTEAFTREDWQDAFDYERYGREAAINAPNYTDDDGNEESVYQYWGVDEGDNVALGEAIVDESGGIEAVEEDKLHEYANMELLGRDLRHEGTWVKTYDKDNNRIMVQVEDF